MTLNLTPPPPMSAEEAEAARLAEQIDSGQAEDGKEAFTARLPARFAAYLRERAAYHGEAPNDHLARILRQFWQNDDWRLTDTRPREADGSAGSGKR